MYNMGLKNSYLATLLPVYSCQLTPLVRTTWVQPGAALSPELRRAAAQQPMRKDCSTA